MDSVVARFALDGSAGKSISLEQDYSQRAIEFRKASIMLMLNVSPHNELVYRITKFQTLQSSRMPQADRRPVQREAESLKPLADHRPGHSNKSETARSELVGLNGTCSHPKLMFAD